MGMTKKEFEKRYQKASKITPEFYKEWLVTMKCSCSYEECQGWAAISNNLDSIRTQVILYVKEKHGH